MSDIKTDIKIGLKYLNAESYFGGIPKEYGFVFARTNEDIGTYFLNFPINNGVVATVAGSGDHQLQASLYSPKEIHVFDKNPFAIQMAKLKTAGCLALPYEKFDRFFNNCFHTCYSIDDYKIIRDYLDKDCREFWDAMYKKGKFEKKHRRFVRVDDFIANAGENSYEREDNFDKTKSNLEKISIYYYHAELFEFFNETIGDKKFDAVFLSNIYDWLPSEKKEMFEEFIKIKIGQKLTEKGIIAVYSPVKSRVPLYYVNDTYECSGLEKVFTESFDMDRRDKVLIYRKNEGGKQNE